MAAAVPIITPPTMSPISNPFLSLWFPVRDFRGALGSPASRLVDPFGSKRVDRHFQIHLCRCPRLRACCPRACSLAATGTMSLGIVQLGVARGRAWSTKSARDLPAPTWIFFGLLRADGGFPGERGRVPAAL